MNLNAFYDEVAKLADTDKVKIGAADTKRVLAVSFSVLAKLDAATALEVIARGVALAKKKGAPKK